MHSLEATLHSVVLMSLTHCSYQLFSTGLELYPYGYASMAFLDGTDGLTSHVDAAALYSKYGAKVELSKRLVRKIE